MQNPKIRESISDSIRFGIVASCDGNERVIDLPYRENVDFERLKKQEPRVAALWELYYRVAKIAFGETSVFYGISEQQDSELQRFGQSLVPNLLSGRYDRGFSEFCGREVSVGDNENCDAHPTQTLLHKYMPNAKVPDRTPKLMDAEQFHFIKYVAPLYPRLAQFARIESKVSLDAYRRSANGKDNQSDCIERPSSA